MASVVVAIGVGAVACSSSEKTGSANQAITELGCAIWPTDSADSSGCQSLGGAKCVTGTTTSSWTVDCTNPSVTSTDGQYNTTYCTHAYVWELTQVNSDGGCDGRKLNVYVTPATIPTDQTDCEATSATFYLYGLTAANEYIYTSSVQSKACTWSSTFGCSCDASLADVDLDNWPTDPDGGTTSVDGMRIVGQVYNSNLGNYVKLRESVGEYNVSPCCVHAPSP